MRQLNRFIDKILFFTTALTSISFFIIIILAVASRYIFKAPILASIELSRLLFVWSCFLAAALAYRRKAHISITFIFEKFPHFLQKYVTLFLHILILLFLVIVFHQSVIVTVLLWPSRLPMLQITQSWFYLPVPIFSLILIFYTLEFLVDDLGVKKE
ncbi:TRAP transporter small permease [candidate division KSB1 bacterium]|nr:TRAP transporter small permease [candidate division KSB1 bacterium]RQW05564.1 MAG: TRAP transporter small permease [candidate division KSB1 bacterium]